ncbi:GNAT family N-acetyltransferase [Enterococcus sp. HY326]|uniref:GNAT family N-acetyltransferase n=1 Tax=Enterococcus sp. HY326 TaxID=2971265 RepID=UPI00223E9125|nr:GNAT family protein [Enterococcus sp. HY326]
MIEFQTKRLIIRDHQSEDLASHHQLFSNPQVMYYLPELQTFSFAESQANLQWAIEESKKENRENYFFGIFSHSKERIGEIGYSLITDTPLGKHVEVGYFLQKEFEGFGYMTEAFKEVLRFAFFENDVYRIFCGCLKENIASEKVMQKCGLIKEGDFKKFQWHQGAFKDRLQYRLLKEEFLKL